MRSVYLYLTQFTLGLYLHLCFKTYSEKQICVGWPVNHTILAQQILNKILIILYPTQLWH